MEEEVFAFAREIKRLRAALDDRENDDGNLVKRLRDELNHNNNGRTDLTKSIQDAEREVLFAEFKAKDRDRDVVDLQTRLALHEKESAEKIALLKGEHSAQVALLKEQLEVQRTKIDKIGQIERHAFDVTRENGELKQRINNQGSELAVAHQAAMNKARHNALQLVNSELDKLMLLFDSSEAIPKEARMAFHDEFVARVDKIRTNVCKTLV